MTKQEIIKIVTDIEKSINPDKRAYLFTSENKRNENKKIGCNQFRDIAALCRGAQCYEEIEMLVRYSMSKCKNGESWMFKCNNGKQFGRIVLECMEKIYNEDNNNCLNNLELFFGYLYWQSRIWTAESKKG